MKIFYFDVETTGLQPWKHDIVQLACLIEIDGTVKEEKAWYMRPFDESTIDQKALDVNNLTMEQLQKFPEPTVIFGQELIPLLAKYIDKYDRYDKFCPAGFNVGFDVDFLREFFKKNGDKYYGSWFNYDFIDPLQVLRFFQPNETWIQDLRDKKLGTVCEKYAIKLDAHEALSDIRATRDLIHQMYCNEFKCEVE